MSVLFKPCIKEKMLFWLCLVVVVGLTPADAASAELPRIFCGRVLADARVLYCYGAEQEKEQKRDVPFPVLGEMELVAGIDGKSLFPYDQDVSVWPWLSSRQLSAQSALAMLRSKRAPGLVDECCLKACYVSELMNYC